MTGRYGITLLLSLLIIGLSACTSEPDAANAQSPTGLTAKALTGAVELRWNGVAPKGYTLERRPSIGAFTRLSNTKQTSFLDANVQGNRAYVYRLLANETPTQPLESNLVFTQPDPMPGEVVLKPAVLNPVKTGTTARLEALTFANEPVTWSVLPNTGTLVVNGRQASFASSQPGTYTITATSLSGSNRKAQTLLRVLKTEEASVLTLVGPAFTYVDATATLRLSVGGSEFSQDLTWTVTPAGPVIARNGNSFAFISNKPGNYTIQAQTTETPTRSSETLTLEVRRSEVTGLSLRANPNVLELGDAVTLEPTFTGNGDFDRSLTWQITPNAPAPSRNLPPRHATYRFVPSSVDAYTIVASSVSNPTLSARVLLQVNPPTQTVTPNGLGRWSTKIDWPERSLDDKDRLVPIHAALMPNGKVMTFGWSPSDGRSQRNDGATWDPVTGAFQTLRNPTSNIFCAGTSLLPDGRLFVAGGLEVGGTEKGIPDLNIFDATLFDKTTAATPQAFSSGGWVRLKDMPEARYYPSTLTLGNGEVFISGGTKADESFNTTSDLWKPSGEVVRLNGAARASKRFYPMLFQASDGSIFEVGPRQGIFQFGTEGNGSAREVLDRDNLFRDYGSAVMYRPGKIIVIGGDGAEDNSSGPSSTAKIINISNPDEVTIADTGSMAIPRRQHNAVILANGQVLIVGGSSGAGFNNGAKGVLSSEVWDPISGKFKTLASMSIKRMYHSIALLLPDARVLAAGGGRGTPDAPDEANGEVFSPPYLFNNDGTPATRPVISSAPATVSYGTAFTINTDTPNLARATLVRLSSVTHSTNFDQRFIELPILARDGNNLTVSVNSDRFVTQPGYYMLFVLNAQGVPSVSKILQLQ
jgi:hypothetical protein